jgi:hypothetical protein
MFVPGRPFQPSLIFVDKAGAYPSEAPFKCSTLGSAPGLTHKHKVRLKRHASGQHFSLFLGWCKKELLDLAKCVAYVVNRFPLDTKTVHFQDFVTCS